MNKLIFYAKEDTFDLTGIGGIENHIKRLIDEHSVNQREAEICFYGDRLNHEVKGFTIKCFYEKSILSDYLINSQAIIINVYTPIVDRIYFAYKLRNSRHALIVSTYPRSIVKKIGLKFLAILDKRTMYLCMSQRIVDLMEFRRNCVYYLPPSIKDSFYSKAVNFNEPLRIGYIGRLDFGKGADIAFELFKELAQLLNAEFEFNTYFWQSDQWARTLARSIEEHPDIKLKLHDGGNPIPVESVIDSIDLFILPYRYMDSTLDTPLVPLEILSRGKPFISTRQASIESFMGDETFYMEELDGDKAIRKQAELISHSIEKIMSENRVNVDRYKTSEVYRNLMRLCS